MVLAVLIAYPWLATPFFTYQIGAQALLDALKHAGIQAELSDDIRRTIWEKFVFLVGLSGTTASMRSTIGPIRENAQIVSLMGTLAAGVLAGPAGNQIVTSGDLVEFFEQVREWYGHDPDLLAPQAPPPEDGGGSDCEGL